MELLSLNILDRFLSCVVGMTVTLMFNNISLNFITINIPKNDFLRPILQRLKWRVFF